VIVVLPQFLPIGPGQTFPHHLTPATLKEAMQCAIAYAVIHELKIAICMQALHFQPGLSYLQWGTTITDSATGFAAAPAPAAATAPAPAAAPAPAPGPHIRVESTCP